MRGGSERRILKALCQGRREAYEEVVGAHYNSVRPPDINALDSNGLN